MKEKRKNVGKVYRGKTKYIDKEKEVTYVTSACGSEQPKTADINNQ